MRLAVVVALLVGCSSRPPQPTPVANRGEALAVQAPPRVQLYEHLGGQDGLTVIVEEWIVNIAGDARINMFFANADVPTLRRHLYEHTCVLVGGPCKYTGKDMRTAHAGMAVRKEHVKAILEDLEKALVKFHVPSDVTRDLLAVMAAQEPDIVGR